LQTRTKDVEIEAFPKQNEIKAFALSVPAQKYFETFYGSRVVTRSGDEFDVLVARLRERKLTFSFKEKKT